MTEKPDFFEEDEPIEKIRGAWERGEKGTTGPPPDTTAALDLSWSSWSQVKVSHVRFVEEGPISVSDQSGVRVS